MSKAAAICTLHVSLRLYCKGDGTLVALPIKQQGVQSDTAGCNQKQFTHKPNALRLCLNVHVARAIATRLCKAAEI